MKATIISSSLAALSLAGILTLPALADNSTTNTGSASAGAAGTSALRPHHDRTDCPDAFDAGDAAGVRICRVGDAYRLETTDPAKSGAHEYTGQLTTDGKFTDVQLVRAEQDDSASIDGNGKLNFDFKTYSGIDGVDFHVDDQAKGITFSLYVDGRQIPVNHIWIGDHGRHPENDPFRMHVNRDHRPSPLASPAPAPVTAQ